MVKRVGILALQGDIAEHERPLRRLGAEPCRVRRPADLEDLDGLILPGGESTTISQLAGELGLIEPIRGFAASGLPLWGVCAGLVLLASRGDVTRPSLAVLDVHVERNAFGRQVDSFETELEVAGLAGGPVRAVFIRAPAIHSVGRGVDVLASLHDGTVAAVRQDGILGTAFHPELTGDDRLHALFLSLDRGLRAH